MKTPRMTTIHKGESHLPRQQQCPQRMPECDETHYRLVKAIDQRGSYPIMDLLNEQSVITTLKVYNTLKSKAT